MRIDYSRAGGAEDPVRLLLRAPGPGAQRAGSGDWAQQPRSSIQAEFDLVPNSAFRLPKEPGALCAHITLAVFGACDDAARWVASTVTAVDWDRLPQLLASGPPLNNQPAIEWQALLDPGQWHEWHVLLPRQPGASHVSPIGRGWALPPDSIADGSEARSRVASSEAA